MHLYSYVLHVYIYVYLVCVCVCVCVSLSLSRSPLTAIYYCLRRYQEERSRGAELLGMLEMQLAHSLLNSIFHDCLQEHPDFQ